MSEEASNPDRDVPRAINVVLVAVLVVYLGISMTALSALPVGANMLPVKAATEQTMPVEVVPKSGRANGPFVFRGDPPPGNAGEDHIRRDGAQQDKTWVIPALEPTVVTFTQDGGTSTKLYGTVLDNVYLEDPMEGIVRFLPDSLGWVRAILCRGSAFWPRRF